jgi:translation initiation factor 4E
MLSLIGETLQDEDDICGAVVSVRKAQDRIAIWSATANAEDRQKAIGRGFRQALVDLGKNETLKYQSHADAAASGSSFQNEVYVAVSIREIGLLRGTDLLFVVRPTDCMRRNSTPM